MGRRYPPHALMPSCFETAASPPPQHEGTETPRIAAEPIFSEGSRGSSAWGILSMRGDRDRARRPPCKARFVAFPCFRPVPPCSRPPLAATRATPPARISRFHPATYGETRNAGLYPAACFSPVI